MPPIPDNGLTTPNPSPLPSVFALPPLNLIFLIRPCALPPDNIDEHEIFFTIPFAITFLWAEKDMYNQCTRKHVI